MSPGSYVAMHTVCPLCLAMPPLDSRETSLRSRRVGAEQTIESTPPCEQGVKVQTQIYT